MDVLSRRQLRRVFPWLERTPAPVPAGERLARAAGATYVLVAAYYLVWRGTSSLNLDALWLAIPLFLAELQGFTNFLVFLHMVWRLPEPEEPSRPPKNATVDVFIPTYNEDVSILRATVLGCLAMRHPHRTYILDDGHRPEVRKLAKELGCSYISRPDNAHAKAGNLNYAMQRTSGRFIATFDADQVPHPDFLVKTLGYFRDESVALVQTPQTFYNQDSIQHAADAHSDYAWHEQEVFYSVIQRGKDRVNAPFWCGSNAVLRRSALESVGGVATESVTEDIHTSLRLHQAGWKTRYIPLRLATGIAPVDYGAFVTQRLRWAQGSMQLLRTSNPLFMRGLTWPQRFSYWASMTTYLESFQKLIYLATPIIVLTTGILPIDNPGGAFILRFAPYFVLGHIANSLLARGYGRHLLTEQYNLLKSVTHMWGALTLVTGRAPKFKVTPKQAQGGWQRRKSDLLLLSPYLVIVALTAFAVVWGSTVIAPAQRILTDRLAIYASGVWALYNAGITGLAVTLILRRKYERKYYRFPVAVPMRVAVDREPPTYVVTRTADVNAEGLSFYSPEPIDRGTPLRILLQLPDGEFRLAGLAVYGAPVDSEDESTYRVGVRIVGYQERNADRLLRFLFRWAIAPGQDIRLPERARAA